MKEDVNGRVKMGKITMRSLHGIIWSKERTKETKNLIYNNIIRRILLNKRKA